MTPQEIAAAYDELIDCAIDIARRAPSVGSIWNDDYCRLSFDSDYAVVSFISCGMDHGDCAIERETIAFPAALLAMTEAELDAWIAEDVRRANEKHKCEALAAARAQEEKELRTLARLAQKYGYSK